MRRVTALVTLHSPHFGSGVASLAATVAGLLTRIGTAMAGLGDESSGLAGGFTDFASLKKVKVTRTVNGHPKAVSVDLTRVMQGKADDPPLLRSDRIEVPQRRF